MYADKVKQILDHIQFVDHHPDKCLSYEQINWLQTSIENELRLAYERGLTDQANSVDE